MKKMNVFADALVVGGTIHSKSVARINGEKVGNENYAKWKFAMANVHEMFYRYEKAVDDVAHGKTADVEKARTAGMNAFQTILDMVGEINGKTLAKSAELFAVVARYAVTEKTELVGDAVDVKNRIAELEKALEFTNGANPEWIEKKEEELAEAEELLKSLKKTAGSGKAVDKKTNFNTFCANFERKLAKLALDQSMKSWEELVAEEEARKAEKRARNKEKRAAKRAAEKAAQAQA